MTLLYIEASEVYHKFVKRLAWFFKKVRLLVIAMKRVQNQNRFKQNTEKFKELVLYISSQWKDAEYSGDTKLNKVLWAIDTAAYDRIGSPVTGARYKRGKYGPRAYPYPPIIEEMKAEGILEIQPEEVSGNHTQHRPIAKRQPNMSLFSPKEIAIIDEWVAEFKDKSAGWVRDWSHGFASWKLLSMDADVPYSSIYWGLTTPDDITPEDRADAREVIARYKGKHIPRPQR